MDQETGLGIECGKTVELSRCPSLPPSEARRASQELKSSRSTTCFFLSMPSVQHHNYQWEKHVATL